MARRKKNPSTFATVAGLVVIGGLGYAAYKAMQPEPKKKKNGKGGTKKPPIPMRKLLVDQNLNLTGSGLQDQGNNIYALAVRAPARVLVSIPSNYAFGNVEAEGATLVAGDPQTSDDLVFELKSFAGTEPPRIHFEVFYDEAAATPFDIILVSMEG